MRILYLVSKEIYDTKMSRVRFHAIDAIGKLTTLKYDGPGWPGYKGIKPTCDSFKPDLIISYLLPDNPKDKGITTPLCVIFNEMGNPKGSPSTVHGTKPDVLIYHYANDMKLWKGKTGNATLINLPQCAEKTIFKDYGLPKKYDVSLVGRSSRIYPFRDRLNRIAKRHLSKKWKYYGRPHPGYRKTNASNNTELIKYAKIINESKITLTCTSKYKYALGKYVEIPMCNSVLAGDIPDERQDFFKSFMLELNPKDSDGVIINKIDFLLRNKSELKRRSKKGMDEMLANYTHEHYAKRFLSKIDTYLGGKL